MNSTSRPSVAVIGAGVSGLTAAHVLGGPTTSPSSRPIGASAGTPTPTTSPPPTVATLRIDSGFIVHNERTYPHLLRLFGELGRADPPDRDEHEHHLRRRAACRTPADADSAASWPSRGGSPTRGSCGCSLRCRASTGRRGPCSAGTDEPGPTWGEFLAAGGLLRHFVRALRAAPGRLRLVRRRRATRPATRPGTCSGSSTTTACSRSTGSPTWRTVVGGSATYVDALAARLPDVRVASPVTAVLRHDDGVDVRTADDRLATLRPGRRRHPRRPGARACSPTPPSRRRRTSARSPTR